MSGELSGTPGAGDVGSYTNVVISVSDGLASASLAAFSIDVVATATGSATLSWTAPTLNEDGTPLTDLAGFRIYWGNAPGVYSDSITINNPGITTYVLQGLAAGTYYFVCTAFDAANTESDLSNTATLTIP